MSEAASHMMDGRVPRAGDEAMRTPAGRGGALVIIVTLIVLFADRRRIDHQRQCHGSPKLAAD